MLQNHSYVMTTLGGIGMVMHMTILMYLVLAEYICYAATVAALAEQVQRLLLPIHPQHAAVSM